MSANPTRPDPLSAAIPPEVIRISLTAEQSEALAAAGPGAFSLVSRGSYPGDPARWIVTAAPADWERAVAASRVLLGTHKAVRIKG